MKDSKKLTYKKFEREAGREEKDIYKDVLKSFPEIGENEIQLKIPLSAKLKYAAMAMFDTVHYANFEEIKLKNTIYLGNYFYKLPDEIKKAVLAHELGHYLCFRKKSVEVLQRTLDWRKQLLRYRTLDSVGSTYRVNLMYLLTDKEQRIYERLKKWEFLDDKYADEEAAKRGYGEPILALLELERDENFSRVIRDTTTPRIKNLEEKLGVTNDETRI